jgi:type VI secretion system ImpA/VasJ family protein
MTDAEIGAAPTEADAAATVAPSESTGDPTTAESAVAAGAADTVAAAGETGAGAATEAPEPPWLRDAREIGGGAIVPDAASMDPSEADELISEIQAEFQRERSVTGGDTDWVRIATQSESLLRTKVKDIRAAAFLAIASGRIDEFEGWSRGLAVIAEMLSAHWPQVRPDPASRMRAHAAQFELVLERLTEDCGRLGTPPLAVAERMRDASERLVAATAAATGAATPLAPEIAAKVKARLDRHISEWRRVARPRTPDASSSGTEGVTTPRPETRSRPAVSEPPPSDSESASRDLPAARKRMLAIAALLQAQDPLRPEPYTLLRAVAWANAEGLEFETGEDRTPRMPMAGPPSRELPASRGPISDQDLVACEAIVAKRPYWLDASVRMAAMLGARDAIEARTAVLAQLTALLARQPRLREARFPDGTPVLSAPLPPLPGGAASGASSDAARRLAEEADEPGEKTAADDRPGTTLERAAAVRGGRARFRATLGALAGRGDLPQERRRAVFADLLDLAASVDLEEWEPSLAAALHVSILDGVEASEGDPVAASLRSRALRGLARVRPDLLIGSDESAAGGENS